MPLSQGGGPQRSPILRVPFYLYIHPLTQNYKISHGNTYGDRARFYPRDVVSGVLATATWLAGWVAGCPSYAGNVSKRLNLSENFFDHLKAPSF